ncbi:hypothetical protein [Tunicatimonas pelagia]|uniref:hypothetical protein n=1 Tax=Tunicatimonas pelagia TaxID=931531 RepID=UPI0026666A8F|nr:hypothetical protein [Tunicatimonas pelagia]WKN42491.1 hypothetical protein P0M28_25990 [Tunicatimonas pelagia]
MSISKLREEYLSLTNQRLLQLAREQHLPVRFNHCFQRIILDTLFQDCWYNHLQRNNRIPAYQQLTEDQLTGAIAIANQMIDNPPIVSKLNQRSLLFRGKLPNNAKL